MSVGRITSSLISGTNENTLALINLNADFSLIKLEAPSEYKELGRSLTHHRREMAEEGALHKTARRLGALFESIAPHAPLVIRAYGTRVSEISRSHSDENATIRHGAFAECIGLDGTSVWAAATSGKSAIVVHLLACMLARVWSGPQATSIWVEFVEARRQELREQIQDGIYDDYTQMGLKASMDLSRHDLAQWDASARSWLQVADDELIRRQKQLMLIINNINMPVTHGKSSFSTYTSVVEAWRTALEALEKLLQGQPHRLSKGSVLLGLASWHLYPDLLVFNERVTTVEFKDPVLEDCAQLTIGLWNPDSNKDEGVYWSLSLSHLRFYGDPIKVTSITTRNASWLSIEELHLLAMGAFLADWESLRVSDFDKAAQFFVALDEAMQGDKRYRPETDNAWGWLRLFGDASRRFLTLRDTEKHIASSHIALGHRRGQNILSKSLSHIPPMMGLCHPWIQQLLRTDMSHTPYHANPPPGESVAVEMMRYFARRLDLRHDECVIMSRSGKMFSTAIPHSADGQRSYHTNWIRIDAWSWRHSCTCLKQGHDCHRGTCECLDQNIICSSACHPENVEAYDGSCVACLRKDLQQTKVKENHRCSNMVAGEAHRYVRGEMFHRMSQDQISQIRLPKDFGMKASHIRPRSSRQQSLASDISASGVLGITNVASTLCKCFYDNPDDLNPSFMLVAGSPDHVALFLRISSGVRARQGRVASARKRAQTEPLHTIEQVTHSIRTGHLPKASLFDYFSSLQQTNQVTVPSFRRGLVVKRYDMKPYFQSLRALSLATKTYKDLPGSTISLGIISMTLHDALWLPSDGRQHLSRQEKFACIAMFESGSYNIDPATLNDVIALSSRNSIFASKLLHHDPSSTEHKDDITRVIGNVGRVGMVLMVAPQAPRLREVELNNFRLVSHAPFDGRSEDSFTSTSLHLRFTEFEMAFDVGQRGAIDKDLCLVETLIQVYDRDIWVGDIDVLPLFNQNNDALRRNKISCRGCSSSSQSSDIPNSLVSIDNWEELLDPPKDLGVLNVAVFRAYDNWVARLAAACICLQKGFRIVINPINKVCWGCCCRKNWDWARETLAASRHAALDHSDHGSLPDDDDDDDDDAPQSEDSSDGSSGSGISSSTFSEPSMFDAVTSVTHTTKFEDLETRPAVSHTRANSTLEELRQVNPDPGYESDETVFVGEWGVAMDHMPQIYIL